MKRYFVWIQYNGTRFSGWQSQLNAITIQEVIESKISIALGVATKIIGCGRTDAGVHASDYAFHFDGNVEVIDHFIFKLNRMLEKDISIMRIVEAKSDSHARFDAEKRTYAYHIIARKNPFKTEIAYHNPHIFKKDLSKLNNIASLFLEQEDFFPFCKSNSDVKNTLCQMHKSEWEIRNDELVYHVEANRFLRGMVRLLVGCCINVLNDRITIQQVVDAFTNKRRLERDLSVPAHGLFLSKISYPENLFI